MAKIYKGHDIDAALCRIGFMRETDGDHLWYYFPNTSVRTKISHGMKGHDIGQELFSMMARQLHLTNKQFHNVIENKINREQYKEILKTKHLLPSSHKHTTDTFTK